MKKSLFLLGSLLFVSSCSSTITPYTPNFEYQRTYHQVDEGIKVDGILDEEAYKNLKFFQGKKVVGNQFADVKWSMHFADQGVYVLIDVNENSELYVNPNRETYLNSGIEMYLMPDNASRYDTPFTLEVDMVANGDLVVRRNIGGSKYGRCDIEDSCTPFLKSKIKEPNQGINGYVHELFIPHVFFQRLGFIKEGEKMNALNADIVHITSQNFEGNNANVDRNYYSFADNQLDKGNAWNHPENIYKFRKGIGFLAYDLNFNVEGPGKIYQEHGYSFAVPNNNLKLLIEPEGKRAINIEAVTINGEDYTNNVKKSVEEGIFEIVLSPSQVLRKLDINIKFK